MASIFHQRSTGENAFFKKRMPVLRRRVQSMSSYFAELLVHWKWIIAAVMISASLLVAFTHRPSRVVARSLITFQIGNAIQSGMLSPAELQTLIGRTDNIRDRQLEFLASYEFQRLLASEILRKEEYADVRQSLMRIKLKEGFRWPWSKRVHREPQQQMIERLRRMMFVGGNGDNNLQIEVEGPTRKFSKRLAEVANEFAVKVIQQTQFQNVTSNLQNIDYQIRDLKTDIDGLNTEVVKFKRDHNMLSTQTLPDDLRNSISNLSKSLVEAEIQLQENSFLIKETNRRAEEANQRILATQGVGFHDQILESKEQELIDQRSMLEAKIKGLKSIIEKENSRFHFVASGEEKINQLKVKLDAKYEQLNLLEQKYKHIQSTLSQLSNSVRTLGDTFIMETRNSMSLTMKLILLNASLFFMLAMVTFYWFEVFPVLSYRDPVVAELEVESMPWFSARQAVPWKKHDGAVLKRAERLCAQKILKKLSGPGMHQVLSAGRGDGKSYLIGMMARELNARGETVCIVDLSGKGSYGDLPANVRVIKDRQIVDGILQDPSAARFSTSDAAWVLLDSSALDHQMGHLLVSPHMDGIIFVGSYLRTKTESFTDWQLKIEQLAGKKAVFVLNKTDLRVDLPFLLMAPAMTEDVKNNRKVS